MSRFSVDRIRATTFSLFVIVVVSRCVVFFEIVLISLFVVVLNFIVAVFVVSLAVIVVAMVTLVVISLALQTSIAVFGGIGSHTLGPRI